MEKNRISWFRIENEQEYDVALARYQEIKQTNGQSDEHKEKLLLAHLISEFEENTSDLPEVVPVELIKIKTEDSAH
ncbi:hypothetical protein [Dyadobacter sp.]|uniref:hypothetical protein n=1 Tax=Dyadobacter sp. TaxID=1914288 RepID=UPI003F718E5D